MAGRAELIDREHVDAPAVDHLEAVVAGVLRQRGVTRRLSVVHEPAGPEQRDVLLEIADRAVRGHRDAPRHVDRHDAELGRHRRAHEERADLEAWMRLAGEKDLRVRDRVIGAYQDIIKMAI